MRSLDCSTCGAKTALQVGLPRATPLAKRPLAIGPATIPCGECGQAVVTGAREWADMTVGQRLSVHLEFLFFGGVLAGQVVAFIAGFVAALLTDSEQLPFAIALGTWSGWVAWIFWFVSRGISDSLARKPEPDQP